MKPAGCSSQCRHCLPNAFCCYRTVIILTGALLVRHANRSQACTTRPHVSLSRSLSLSLLPSPLSLSHSVSVGQKTYVHTPIYVSRTYMHTYIQTDRQLQPGRQTDIQMYIHTKLQQHTQTHKCGVAWIQRVYTTYTTLPRKVIPHKLRNLKQLHTDTPTCLLTSLPPSIHPTRPSIHVCARIQLTSST